MNSIVLDPVATDRELIRFQHPDEWQSRLGFRDTINFAEHAPSRIVGGYDLPKQLYQHCGLAYGGKPCNQEHGHGFVVATVDGFETHIGKDCGHRHMGAKFDELERQFTLALAAQDRVKRLRDLLSHKSAMLSRARQAMHDCDRAASAVADYKHKITREPTLSAAFGNATSTDGDVFVDYRVSDDEFERTKRRYRREVVGRIDGHSAATARSPKPLIQDIVLPLVHSLTEEMLSGLTSKQLAAKSREANEATSTLIDADAYIALSKRFTARRNWQAFAAAFSPERLKTNDRGRRILAQLIEMGTE